MIKPEILEIPEILAIPEMTGEDKQGRRGGKNRSFFLLLPVKMSLIDY